MLSSTRVFWGVPRLSKGWMAAPISSSLPPLRAEISLQCMCTPAGVSRKYSVQHNPKCSAALMALDILKFPNLGKGESQFLHGLSSPSFHLVHPHWGSHLLHWEGSLPSSFYCPLFLQTAHWFLFSLSLTLHSTLRTRQSIKIVSTTCGKPLTLLSLIRIMQILMSGKLIKVKQENSLWQFTSAVMPGGSQYKYRKKNVQAFNICCPGICISAPQPRYSVPSMWLCF